MIIVSTTGAESIGHGDETFTPNSAGEFDIPEDLGHHLLSFPGWALPGEAPADDTSEDDSAVTAELRARIVELEAQVEQLTDAATKPPAKRAPRKATAKPAQ